MEAKLEKRNHEEKKFYSYFTDIPATASPKFACADGVAKVHHSNSIRDLDTP